MLVNPFRLLAYQFQFTHPGRGATSLLLGQASLSYCFNSRTPGGVRPSKTIVAYTGQSFNSRTPGGVRLQRDNTQSRALGFNSRTPGGVRRGTSTP